MSYFEQIKATLREKSGKKLIGFTVAVFLLTALIAFAAMLLIGGSIEMKLMDQYLREIPKIVDARAQELETRGRVYEDDALARGELGLKLFQAEDGLSDAEKLEKVRSAVFADSVCRKYRSKPCRKNRSCFCFPASYIFRIAFAFPAAPH